MANEVTATRANVERHGASLESHAARALVMRMEGAGWVLSSVDLDLTGAAPKVEIRAIRFDGLWIRAHVDQLGRATPERFQRDCSLGMPKNRQAGARLPMSPQLEDRFLGRQRYEGARTLMRYLCAYLTDNALHPIALPDMRAAWAALMQAPARIESTAV